jgi:hypothetical protein
MTTVEHSSRAFYVGCGQTLAVARALGPIRQLPPFLKGLLLDH